MAKPLMSSVPSNGCALIEALFARKARKAALGNGITNATLEALTGLQPGYVGTLFGSSRGRSLGGTSFGLLLGGLALKLIVVEDLDAARRMEKRWEQRERPLDAERRSA
jgi:hypothetical protein